ncbi:MAG: hypothetical protein ACJZ8O_01595 [Pirellulaceae bacterium]
MYDFELAQPKMIYSIYYPGKLSDEQPAGTIAAHYKSEEQMRAELSDMVAHGVRYPNLWQKYSEDLVPRVLQLRKEAGMSNDRLFINMPAGAPHHSAGKIEGWRKLTKSFGFKDIYLYGEDEAHGNQLRIQKPSWANVQKAGGKMYASAWKEDPFEVMGGLLNVLVWSGGCQPEKAKRWHSVGSEIFSYSNPQVGVEEPLLYRYNYGLALWKADYDGAMTFAYQWAYGHIWNDFDSENFRDHCFSYPTINGVVGTIQWEGFREGVDDVRYITTLEQAIEKAGDTEIAHTARRWLAGLKAESPSAESRVEITANTAKGPRANPVARCLMDQSTDESALIEGRCGWVNSHRGAWRSLRVPFSPEFLTYSRREAIKALSISVRQLDNFASQGELGKVKTASGR